jgi:hypothetical protein
MLGWCCLLSKPQLQLLSLLLGCCAVHFALTCSVSWAICTALLYCACMELPLVLF